MKYVSIDIETTGLSSDEHQIIEFAAIIEDSSKPKSYEDSKKYTRVLISRDRNYNFSSFAANLNAELISTISKIENGGNVSFENNENLTSTAFYIDELIPDFKTWLIVNGFKESSHGVIEIVAAGKNFASFDKRFIEAIPDFESYGLKFNYRSLDPTGFFINWDNDIAPPSTNQCLDRAGFKKQVTHKALLDAWDVITLLRNQYNHKFDLRPRKV